MERTWLLPAMSALGLGTTTACGSPIVGKWELRTVSAYGYTTEFPVESFDDEGFGYSRSSALRMRIGGEARFESEMHTTNEFSERSYTSSYSGTWERGEERRFGIAIPGFGLDLSCEIDDGLTCTSGNQTMAFQKQPF